MQFFGFLAWPISWILNGLYTLFDSYGLAIIILTVAIRCALFPLTLKQMRSQKDMQRLQPKIKAIEKKYKGNKQAIQEATMALYKQENVSMTGGCLPMVIQLFVIMGLYQAIYRPLYYLYKFSNDQIEALRAAYNVADKANESTIAMAMNDNPSLMNGIIDNFQNFIHFDFLGLNLAQTPAPANFTDFGTFFASADVLWIIPILALVTGFFSAYMSRKMMPGADPQAAKENPMLAQTAKMSRAMMWVMPIMSLYFASILPAGVGLYWAIANLIAGLQQIIIHNKLKKYDDIPVTANDGLMEKPKKRKRDDDIMQSPERKARPQGQRPKRPQGQAQKNPRPDGERQKPKLDENGNPIKKKPPVRQPGQRVAPESDEAASNRPQGQRPAGQRPPGQRPAGQRPAGQRPPGQRPAHNERPTGARPKPAETQENSGGEMTDD